MVTCEIRVWRGRVKTQKWKHLFLTFLMYCQIQAKDGKGLIQAGVSDSSTSSLYPG